MSSTELYDYATLYQSCPLGVAVVDTHGKVIWHNGLAAELLGTQCAKGKTLLNSSHWPQFRDSLRGNKPFYFNVEEQGLMFIPQPMCVDGVDRIAVWFLPSISMEMDLVAMQQDIVRQRKFVNLGRMMSEMAHELNNPLAGISMASQLIGMSLKKLKQMARSADVSVDTLNKLVSQMEQELKKVTQCTNKAANLRQNILHYGKPQELNMKPYHLQALLGQFLSHFNEQPIFQQMTLQQEGLFDSIRIVCDANKLEQIFYNLLKNAHDATDGKGQVWIRSHMESTEIVLIEVEDNGPGIPPGQLEKIFSPFHTTKPRTGNGLGLSISQQIIQDHGGTFCVYNKAGSGACFQIRLPAQQVTHAKLV